MVASITAQELEQDLVGVEASISDLVVANEGELMADKTWDFGESSITEEMITKMEEEGYFKAGQAKPPPVGETVPSPAQGYAIVFRVYFTCGLRLPPISFLRQVLEVFHL
jgi:hypothetical protein